MRFILYTSCISPHQLPLFRCLAEHLGCENCRYIYTEQLEGGRKALGWEDESDDCMLYEDEHRDECRKLLENCDVLMSGIRDFTLFEHRVSHHLITLYSSERWFKPLSFKNQAGIWGMLPPGWLKLLHPSYFRMAWRFRKLLKCPTDNCFYYFPISLHAAKDAALLCCASTKIDFVREAGGEVCLPQNTPHPWQQKLRLWGYFVSSSTLPPQKLSEKRSRQHSEIIRHTRPLRLLWVGRMLALKNIDTIIEAVRIITLHKGKDAVTLTLVGDGHEKPYLMAMSQELPVTYMPFVPIEHIRKLMQEHDLYIFASNSFDGWGAVISEALEERMPVIASTASGAGSTVLPPECLFDYHHPEDLAKRIMDYINLPTIPAEKWSARYAANYLLEHFFQ